MKKIICSVILAGIFGSLSFGADCASLREKYSAPNPATKTMAQLSRWVGRKVQDKNDAKELETCLIAQAADNPNKEQVAGRK